MWFGFVFSAILVAWLVVDLAESIRDRDRHLALARERALQDEKIIAMGTLAAGAAHELGTPLSTMAIIIEQLLKKQTEHKDPRIEIKN
jgi:two-component system sensor histidine kinase RegB